MPAICLIECRKSPKSFPPLLPNIQNIIFAMRTSEIRLKIELDDKNVPEKLFWHAEDGPASGLEETKAFNLSLWDPNKKDTLTINLWAKDMPMHEMKRYYIDMVSGLSRSILQSTNDEVMAGELEMVCQRLAQHVAQENAQQ